MPRPPPLPFSSFPRSLRLQIYVFIQHIVLKYFKMFQVFFDPAHLSKSHLQCGHTGDMSRHSSNLRSLPPPTPPRPVFVDDLLPCQSVLRLLLALRGKAVQSDPNWGRLTRENKWMLMELARSYVQGILLLVCGVSHPFTSVADHFKSLWLLHGGPLNEFAEKRKEQSSATPSTVADRSSFRSFWT